MTSAQINWAVVKDALVQVRDEEYHDYAEQSILIFFSKPHGEQDINDLIEIATKKAETGAGLNTQDLVELFDLLIALGIYTARD